MKRKAIHAELRKESKTFNGWLKYEVTIQNEDGSVEKVPAYGKDLQDALSRVVHDEKVVKLEKKTKRIPDLVWVVLWFGYILGLANFAMSMWASNTIKSVVFISGLTFVTGLVLLAKNWFRQRNIEK
jgi:vacuolar-type H+-ATPase subunit I/STV1